MGELDGRPLDGAQVDLQAHTLAGGETEVDFYVSGIRRNLHLDGERTTISLIWGTLGEHGEWQLPAFPPPNSAQSDGAMRTPLNIDGKAEIRFPYGHAPKKLSFVVLVESEGNQYWLKAAWNENCVFDVVDAAKARKAG